MAATVRKEKERAARFLNWNSSRSDHTYEQAVTADSDIGDANCHTGKRAFGILGRNPGPIERGKTLEL